MLLAYYDDDGRLVYAGRAGSGFSQTELQRVWRRLQPLAVKETPLDVLPPRGSRFGSPLVLSRVHWVRPALVAEVTFLTWTAENLLRQVVYQGLREDKPAREVRRPVPNAAPPSTAPAVAAPEKPRRWPKREKSLAVPRENILQLLSEAVVPAKEQLAEYWTRAGMALLASRKRPAAIIVPLGNPAIVSASETTTRRSSSSSATRIALPGFGFAACATVLHLDLSRFSDPAD